MKNKERYIWISLVAILSCSLFQPIERVKAISTDGEKYLQILHEVVAFIETDYVESVEEKNLYVGAIKGLIASLGDPHSRFMGEDEFRHLQEETHAWCSWYKRYNKGKKKIGKGSFFYDLDS